MKAYTLTLTQLFNHPICFIVPLYQRPYVWNRDEHWAPLWEDIRSTTDHLLGARGDLLPGTESSAAEEQTSPHFLGAVVVEQVPVGAGMIDVRNVIDGQQRLMTLQLFIDAAHDVAKDAGDDRARLFSMLTENDKDLVRTTSDRHKVWPSKFDQDAFQLAMDGETADDREDFDPSGTRIWQAHEFFVDAVRSWLTDGSPELDQMLDALRTTLWRLIRLVVIDLEPNDNAQVIFETLNARGTPLLASDLIKNTVFRHAATNGLAIDHLYDSYWKSLDADWWREEVAQGRFKRPRLDLFFFQWLTMRLNSEIAVHDVFPEFKRFMADTPPEQLLSDIQLHAKTYQSFESFASDSWEGIFFHRLKAMETATATPVLLFVMAHDDVSIPAEQKRLLARAIESWLARRVVCRLTTKNYNQVFLALLSAVQKEPQLAGDVTVAFLRGLSGESQRWPDDDDVLSSLLSLPIYKLVGRSRLRMLLEAIENELRTGMADEASVGSRITIEHILPQSWEANWPMHGGIDSDEARARRDVLKHTLGNLTFVNGNLNSKLSNDPWELKHETLREHITLFLNKDVVNRYQAAWNEESIIERGRTLAEIAMRIWPGPHSTEWPAEAEASPEAERFMREHAEGIGGSGADVGIDGATASTGALTHEEIALTVQTDFLREVLNNFEEWLLARGLTVRHMKGTHHSLYMGKQWVGGYYFANRWIHFWLRGRYASDGALQGLTDRRSLSLKEQSVVGNVANDADLKLLKDAITERLAFS